jgi:hypothetical protein
MTTPNPVQEVSEEINALQNRVYAMQESVHLTKSREAVEKIQTNVGSSVSTAG